MLSALSLEGARSSERQMVASSWLLMIASLAFSYATPLDKMHPTRPLRSLFHPAVALSMLGQALIHLFAMCAGITADTPGSQLTRPSRKGVRCVRSWRRAL